MLHKTNVEGYAKDVDTGVVINTNNNDYISYVQNRERSKKMRDVENDIAWLKKECAEIKELFKKFCEKN